MPDRPYTMTVPITVLTLGMLAGWLNFPRPDEGPAPSGPAVVRRLDDSSTAKLLWQVEHATALSLRLRAVQALYGQPQAVPLLSRVLWGDEPIELRLETVRALGGVKTDEARRLLQHASEAPDLDEQLREAVRQELGLAMR